MFYVIVIVVFAFAYLLLWRTDVDSFIPNEQLNLFPISGLKEIGEKSIIASEGVFDSARRLELARMQAEYHNQMTELTDSKEKMQQQLDMLRSSLAVNLRSMKDDLSRHWSKQDKTAVDGLTKEKIHLEEIQRTTLELNPFTLRTCYDGPYMSFRQFGFFCREQWIELIAYNQSRIDSLDSEIRKATLNANLNALLLMIRVDDSLLPRSLRPDIKIYRDLTILLDTVERKMEELKKVSIDRYGELYSQRVDDLGFWDFVYFSIGISTTTTFGDILPNRPLARMLVSFQQIASLFLVALILNCLRPRRD